MQEGINEPKVESHGNVVVIHLQDEDALIQMEDNSTHVVCNGDEKLRTKLRNIVMQCLKKF
jgi:integrator complex subunit 9